MMKQKEQIQTNSPLVRHASASGHDNNCVNHRELLTPVRASRNRSGTTKGSTVSSSICENNKKMNSITGEEEEQTTLLFLSSSFSLSSPKTTTTTTPASQAGSATAHRKPLNSFPSTSAKNKKNKSTTNSSFVMLLHRPRLSYARLARRRQFHRIAAVLNSVDVDHNTVYQWLHRHTSRTRQTPLHLLLWCRPPASLVDLLIQKLTVLHAEQQQQDNNSTESVTVYTPEYELDEYGRTAVHIAAAAGCTVPVVERLLDGTMGVMPAIVQDLSGRCPLHWASSSGGAALVLQQTRVNGSVSRQASTRSLNCENAADAIAAASPTMPTLLPRLFLSRSSSTTTTTNNTALSALRKPALVRRQSSNASGCTVGRKKHGGDDQDQKTKQNVVRLLLEHYPEAVLIRDHHGCTPYDLAVRHHLDSAVVRLLEETRQRVQRENGGHDDDNNAKGKAVKTPMPVICTPRTASASRWVDLDFPDDEEDEDDDVSSLGTSHSRDDFSDDSDA